MSRAALFFLLVAVTGLGCGTAGPCAEEPNGNCYNAPISLNAQAFAGDAGLCTVGAGDDTCAVCLKSHYCCTEGVALADCASEHCAAPACPGFP